MNEALIANWNAVVGMDDIVYHLGDVALGPWTEWNSILNRLNGYKILVIGNHDRIFSHNKQAHIERFMPIYYGWFSETKLADTIRLFNGQYAHLCHFPYEGDSHDADRFNDMRILDDGIPLIHGHTHANQVISRSSKGTVQIHVGVDAHSFTPVSEQQVIDYLRIANDLDNGNV